MKKPQQLLKLKRGDRVAWTSQANGSEIQKTGTVLAIVPPLTLPEQCIPANVVLPNHGDLRRELSYVVSVRVGRRNVAYWPRTSALREVKG